ncbi:hypothetical protein NKH77_39345 [Streptomyces sp. M19]
MDHGELESGPGASPPVTLPTERITHWNADGSGYYLTVATDPRHPGEPVIDGSGEKPRTVHDGKVIEKGDYPAGISGANETYFEPPPSGTAAMRAYLADFTPGADRDTDGLLDAVKQFLGTGHRVRSRPRPSPRCCRGATTCARRGRHRPPRPPWSGVCPNGALGTADDHPRPGRRPDPRPRNDRHQGRSRVPAQGGDVMQYWAWMP